LRPFKTLFPAIFLLLVVYSASAQRTYIWLDPEFSYKLGLELFEKQKYVAAQKEFLKALESPVRLPISTQAEAEYYHAVCAMELFNKDAEYLLLKFTEHHKESPRVNMARFELGKLFYRNKNYKRAAEYFAQTEVKDFSEDDLAEFHFKNGYANYNLNEFEKATKSFAEIKDKDTKYSPAANYYYCHIAYLNKNYETALQGFLKLSSSENFGPVVPNYIAQIYYLQNKYDELIQYAQPLLDSGSIKNRAEVLRMIAEAYYRKGNYEKVIPNFTEYMSLSPNTNRMDYYQLAYCYYKTSTCKKAIENFRKVTDQNDSLAQNAYYHLGDCFVKANDKSSARSAFLSASKTNFDAAITEDAMFSYAKLTYETSLQSSALDAFRNFIKTYPESRHIDEANEMLVVIFTTTKNYRDALELIATMKNKSPRIKAAYQRSAYFRAIELYNDNKSDEAIELFDEAIKEPSNATISALALYWEAEAQYRQNNFDAAIRSYNDFIYTPKAVTMTLYNIANYNLGYCYFKKEDYSNSLVWLRKYIREKTKGDEARYNDALLRIADAFFVQKDYSNAMDYYDKAVAEKAKSTDYAYFQKGIIQGLLSKNKEKIVTLQNILGKYPSSPYFDDAMYETGFAYFQTGNTAEALNHYKKIVSDYPQSSYVKKALLGEGLVYYNNKQDDLALQTYKQVVTQYPSSPEAKEALTQIENLYVKLNKVDEYLAYTKTVPSLSITSGKQDTLTYQSAELRYTKGECDKAVMEFNNYLSKYPQGSFVLNSSFYRSQCLYQQKKFDDALAGFTVVLNSPNSAFTEKSLLHSAEIYFREKKQYDKALETYTRLETSADFPENIVTAQAGQMRSNYLMQKYEQAIIYAQKVLQAEDVSPQLKNETHLIYGKSSFNLNDLAAAQTQLSFLSKLPGSEAVAEAKYLLALIQNKMNNYKESQKICFEIVNQVPAYDYWVAKGFILLGDNYLALKDTFQAKETYKSIIDNYERSPSDPDDLRAIASEKMSALIPKPAEIKVPEEIKEEEEEIK
jgi:TolA-binding protein